MIRNRSANLNRMFRNLQCVGVLFGDNDAGNYQADFSRLLLKQRGKN